MKVKSLSHVRLFETPWTAAHQPPPSMGFHARVLEWGATAFSRATVYWVTESDTTERVHFPCSLSCIGEGNGTPLQCSCLENPRDGSLVGCRLWGCTESDTYIFIIFVDPRHSGCFHVLAIVNSAAVSVGVRVSFWTVFFSR